MSLEDRRRELESRYAHDQEKRFKIESRRNKLFGLWAAERLGRSGAEAEDYAQEVIKASFAKAGDDDIVEKVQGDLAAAGHSVSPADLERELERCLADAESQIAAA